jgi:hypothetical protein
LPALITILDVATQVSIEGRVSTPLLLMSCNGRKPTGALGSLLKPREEN